MLCGESTTGTFGNGGGLALTREGRMQLPAAHGPCPALLLSVSIFSHRGSGVFKVVTHQAPPKGICVGLKLLFHLSSLSVHLWDVFLNQVDKK